MSEHQAGNSLHGKKLFLRWCGFSICRMLWKSSPNTLQSFGKIANMLNRLLEIAGAWSINYL